MLDIKLAELVTMLLNEHPEDDIYLGSKSAFFFIGTPAELLLNLQDLNDRYFKYFSEGYDRYENKIIELLNNCPDGDITKKKGKLEVTITYKDAYRAWKAELAEALKKSCHFEDCLSRFEPLASRKVRDFRFRQNKKEGRIIVITGDETGNYRMKSDLNKDIPFWDDDEEGGYDG